MFRKVMLLSFSLLLFQSAIPSSTAAEEKPKEAAVQPPAQPSVFDLPAIQMNYLALQAQFINLMQQGKFAEAEESCRNSLKLVPNDLVSLCRLACALSMQKKCDEAVKTLDKAISLGFNDSGMLEREPSFANLRFREDFNKLVKKAPTATPDPNAPGWKFPCEAAEIKDGIAMVTEKNTAYDTKLGILKVLFKFPQPRPNLPIAVGLGETGDLLRKWYSEGTASGNYGELYDNHDGDHSNMDYAAFPQISRVEFCDIVKAKGFDKGLQMNIFYNAPTIGNSSMAMVGTSSWRSMPRMALCGPQSPLLYLQYVSNQLYFYPEHTDYDSGHNGEGGGHGDVLPANTPYYIISQGSSGSDKVFMDAICAAMAALRPEVKTELVRNGMLAPTLQTIFRMSNKMVKSPEDYLSGKAHPTVFDGTQLDMARMVRVAHDMNTETLPPIALLKVTEEDQSIPGVDYFGIPGREIILNTPCAIARVALSMKYTRRMVVSAEESKDLKGKPLTYHWVILRGDADKIKIKPLNKAGSIVEILISYQGRRPIEPGSPLESNRIDIGAFVKNNKYYSPPSFISVMYLDNEKRIYDAKGRIQSVDYNDPIVSKNYVDPMLILKKNWRDEYNYADDGKMTGWTRVRGDKKEKFIAEGGALITKTDAAGKPTEFKKINYNLRQDPSGVSEMEELPATDQK